MVGEKVVEMVKKRKKDLWDKKVEVGKERKVEGNGRERKGKN